MTDYTIQTNFGAKDSLPSGNAAKVVKGSEFTTEFTNIATAVNSKADTAGDTFTGVVNFSDDIAVNTNTLFVDVSTAKVGIGTTPQSKLHVQASSSGATGVADATLIVEQGSAPSIQILSANTQTQSIKFGDPEDGDVGKINYSHADNHMALFTDGTEAMRIAASGNVGIGTSSPNEKLVVKGGTYAVNQSGGMALQMGDEGGSHWKARFKIKSDGSGVPRTVISGVANNSGGSIDAINISNTGNVGIGTNNPQRKLHVESEVRIQGTYPKLEFVDTDNNPDFTIIGGNAQLLIYDETNATSRMKIDSSGNVGIGTSSPQSDGNTTNLEVSSAFGSRVLVNNTSTNGRKYGVYSDNSGKFGFADYTADVTRMLIDSSGNVGIGTSSPFGKLGIVNDEAGDVALSVLNERAYGVGQGTYGSALYLGKKEGTAHQPMGVIRGKPLDEGSSLNGFLSFETRYNSTVNERMRIDSSGIVLIGTTDTSLHTNNASGANSNGAMFTPHGEFMIARYQEAPILSNRMGNDGSVLSFYNRGSYVGKIQSTSTGVSLQSGSDRSLKQNIEDADDAGSLIDSVQIRQFDWIRNGEHQNYGVVAQELEEVLPELVSGHDEESLTVDYMGLVPMLVKEVQSLRSRVAELENV